MYDTTAALIAARSAQCARVWGRPIARDSGDGHEFFKLPSQSAHSPAIDAFLDLPEHPRLRRTPMPLADRREGADLVVVGASVGGLAAAVTAADRGCQVVLVERAKELGGNAAGTDGAIVAAGSRWQRDAGLDDDPERLATDLAASAVAPGEAEVIRVLAAQAAVL